MWCSSETPHAQISRDLQPNARHAGVFGSDRDEGSPGHPKPETKRVLFSWKVEAFFASGVGKKGDAFEFGDVPCTDLGEITYRCGQRLENRSKPRRGQPWSPIARGAQGHP